MAKKTAHTPDVTRLLKAWSAGAGGEDALEELLRVVYDELRGLARAQLARERGGHTLQPTDLVHEAFVRLVDQRASWQSRIHFYGIAATCMRRVLVDYARRRGARKRPQFVGGVEASEIERMLDPRLEEMLAVNEALDRLAATEPRQARVAELKVFSGLQNDEIAALLNVSVATVKRDWDAARTMLLGLLSEAS